MSVNRLIRKRKLAFASVAVCALIAVPTQAQQAGQAITQQEAQQGAQYHQQFLDEFGGAMGMPRTSRLPNSGDAITLARNRIGLAGLA